jgi:hypothetical protein
MGRGKHRSACNRPGWLTLTNLSVESLPEYTPDMLRIVSGLSAHDPQITHALLTGEAYYVIFFSIKLHV